MSALANNYNRKKFHLKVGREVFYIQPMEKNI